MSTRINTNTTAFEAARNLSINSDNVSKNIQRLSSGLRINSASDDAAGLVISESLRAQSAGLTQATRNTNDAINVVKTAEGALNEVHSLLINIRQLVVHAANVGANDATASQADKDAVASAVASIDRIAGTTQFNHKNLLDGSADSATPASAGPPAVAAGQDLTFQIGANAGQTVSLKITDSRSTNIGTVGANKLSALAAGGSLDLSDTTGASQQSALAVVDKAIADISATREKLGSTQSNVLETNVRSLSVSQQNTDASESTIRDTDLSAEIVNFTKNQILVQAGTSALAQANQAPQAILKLLQ